MRVLVTGASGFLGGHVASALDASGSDVIGLARSRPRASAGRFVPLDLAELHAIPRTLDALEPEAVVHAGAVPDVAECEREPALARRINTDATAAIARWCSGRRARLLFFSTDQVFDGHRGHYTEADTPSPIHVYARTKLDAESFVRGMGEGVAREGAALDGGCVLRVALSYGFSPTGTRSPVEQVLRALSAGEPCTLFSDERRTPLLAADLASACVELIGVPSLPSVLHLGGPDALSRLDFGRAVARQWGVSEATIVPCLQKDAKLTTPRPRDVTLATGPARAILARPPRGVEEGLRVLHDADLSAGR